MQRFIFCLLVIFCTTCVSAQQQNGKQYNSLLWRITGNGLSKPSYLYGTMHLTDKRVFQFGDSLYNALEQCEGFAAELDMSSFATQYINLMLNDEDKTTSLTEALDEKKLDEFKEALEKKFGKKTWQITTKEIEKESRAQSNKLLAKGEMKTFMDAYLFDIAARQGKWTGGIEDMEDQMRLMDESLEEQLDAILTPRERTDKTVEWMIKVYLKQDLDLIDRTDEIWRGGKDQVLLKRNVKMARRIDSLSQIRTCLFAIGAAHLPGDSGVVSLLRQRGFTVTPVTSSKKIAPEKYTYKAVERPWIDVETRDSSYSLQMPGKAEVFKVFEDMPFDMKMYFDMGSMMAYMTMHVSMLSVSAGKKKELLAKMIERYRKNDPGLQENDIMIGTEPGKEVFMHNESGELRIQVFIPGNFVTANAVSASKKEILYSADANRFFQSFKSNNIPVKENQLTTTGSNWQTYTFSNHAFSVGLPGKYRERKRDDDKEAWNEKMYEVLDIPANAYYGIIIEETKQGYYSSEDSVYFDKVKEGMRQNMNGKELSSRHFEMGGFPAFESIMETDEDNDNLKMKIFLLNRGNRKYFLLATYEKDKQQVVDSFFSSFSLLSLPVVQWQQETAPDKSFSVWSPSTEKMKIDSTVNLLRYCLYDAASPASVYIDKEILSPYYWIANDSLLFDQRINTFIGYNDSLLEYRKIKNGNTKGVDVVIRLRESHNLKKMRLLLNADTIYTIYGFMPKELVESNDYKKLFENFRITDEKEPAATLFQRKPEALLFALRSKDSVVFTKAKETLNIVEFEAGDLPLLQEDLLYQYQDFDSAYYSSNINGRIASLITELDSNHESVSFIKENYNKINPEYEGIKPFLLSILASVKSRISYDLLKEIIINQPPKIDSRYYFPHHLYDSLELTRYLYPEILSRASDPGLSWLINGVAVSLLDSNLLSRKDILPYKDIFITMAKKELARPKDELEENAYNYYDLVQLLGALNLPEANMQLNRFGKLSDRRLRMKAIIELLKNNQPVDRKEIYTLATTDEFRSELYNELKKMHKESLFPLDYLSQKLLAQSELFGYATEDEAPESISFFGERTEMFMGKKQKFYLYTISFDVINSDYTYLGIAGPYSLDPKDYNSTQDATGLIWDEKFDIKKADEVFKKHLTETEEFMRKDKKE